MSPVNKCYECMPTKNDSIIHNLVVLRREKTLIGHVSRVDPHENITFPSNKILQRPRRHIFTYACAFFFFFVRGKKGELLVTRSIGWESRTKEEKRILFMKETKNSNEWRAKTHAIHIKHPSLVAKYSISRTNSPWGRWHLSLSAMSTAVQRTLRGVSEVVLFSWDDSYFLRRCKVRLYFLSFATVNLSMPRAIFQARAGRWEGPKMLRGCYRLRRHQMLQNWTIKLIALFLDYKVLVRV